MKVMPNNRKRSTCRRASFLKTKSLTYLVHNRFCTGDVDGAVAIDGWTFQRAIIRSSFQVFEEVGSPEVLWNGLVQAGNDLVDGLLPARLGIFAGLDGFEELAQSLRNDVNERGRNLLIECNVNQSN